MKKYEYTVSLQVIRRGSTEETNYLNKMGFIGWELCSVVVSQAYTGDAHYYFKREIAPNI